MNGKYRDVYGKSIDHKKGNQNVDQIEKIYKEISTLIS